MVWMEKEISRIRVVQMDNFKSLLGVNRIDRMSPVKEEFGGEKEVRQNYC